MVKLSCNLEKTLIGAVVMVLHFQSRAYMWVRLQLSILSSEQVENTLVTLLSSCKLSLMKQWRRTKQWRLPVVGMESVDCGR